MFDYDRLALDVTKHVLTSKMILPSGQQEFDSPNSERSSISPSSDENTNEENSIANGLASLLRNCSSSPIQMVPYKSIDNTDEEVTSCYSHSHKNSYTT